MNNTVYLVNLKDGTIITFRLEEFMSHFNENDFLASDYNAYLNKDDAVTYSESIKTENIKREAP